MDKNELIALVEDLSQRLQKPKGGSLQHGGRNYLLGPLNQIRKNLDLEPLDSFYVEGQKHDV